MLLNEKIKVKNKVLTPSGTSCHLPHRGRKRAFTLAEVLITLGVIGVVASMTIPTLIQEHKKSVVVTKLKKASSSLMQAYNLSIAEYGDIALESKREGFTANDPDSALEMFNKYYVPYIKFLKVEKGEKGVFGYMTDGTVLYFRKTGYPQSWSDTYIIVCTDAKACQNMPEEDKLSVNGKNTFGLYTSGKVGSYQFRNTTHDERIEICKNKTGVEACTGLIFEAGWKVPDDYPVKL